MGKKEVALEVTEIAVKTTLSVIPIGGALATSIYDSIKGNCLAKRKEKWERELEARLSHTEETLETIGNNELFTTTLIRATELAMKTAQEEKIQYLANAVVNSLSPDLDEEKMMVMLNLLDKYTVSHIKILYYFYNPRRFDEMKHSSAMGSPKLLLFSMFPELNNELFDKLYEDLFIDGMVNLENLNVMMTGRGITEKRTTPLADSFLNFVFGESLDKEP